MSKLYAPDIDPALQTQNNSKAEEKDPLTMSKQERRKYEREKEKEKLSELSFWRKVQYIIMYYGWKFAGILAGTALIVVIIYRIYIACCPVALDAMLVNDPGNEVFATVLTDLYKEHYEVKKNAVFMMDSNCIVTPDETPDSVGLSYYTKLYSAMTDNSTHIIICDAAVVDSYAADGFILELKHGLPDDLFEAFKDRLYECDGPVEDSDYYAIDLTGTRFAELTQLSQERPLICIPCCLDDTNRETAFHVLQIILDLEDSE